MERPVTAAGAGVAAVLSLLLCVLLLQGCSSGSYAPVSERSLGARTSPQLNRSQGSPTGGYYRVRKGDTLYSIAFRYGKDFRGLARANGIADDYRIYPGQRIRLAEAPPQKVIAQPGSKSSSSPATVTRSQTQPQSRPQRTNQKPVASASSSSPSAASGKVDWDWPSEGKVIQRYRSRGKINKGINIAAETGAPVAAAASGQVVYAGSGLLGYGNLIIIKHNQQFLSAYAHNSKLFVSEQDQVKRGQKIAEVGNSGTTRTMLHFEIRRDGKPVDPLKYLPKR